MLGKIPLQVEIYFRAGGDENFLRLLNVLRRNGPAGRPDRRQAQSRVPNTRASSGNCAEGHCREMGQETETC